VDSAVIGAHGIVSPECLLEVALDGAILVGRGRLLKINYLSLEFYVLLRKFLNLVFQLPVIFLPFKLLEQLLN
jgi:hypothetical protein